MCRALKVLPRAGGLLDQDYYDVLLLRAGLNALAEKDELEQRKAQSKATAGSKGKRKH